MLKARAGFHHADEPPDELVETVRELFEEAKRDFSILYPTTEAVDFSVEVEYLRPRDVLAPSPSVESAS